MTTKVTIGPYNKTLLEKTIKTLKNNNDVAISLKLFQEVRQFVIDNAQQTPEHSMIHGTGHDGGDFLFFPKS